MTTRLSVTGQIAQLRVNELGTGYGPPEQRLDAEAIVFVRGRQEALGLQLRDDQNLPARQAMFDLLQDGASQQTPVSIDYDAAAGATWGSIVRITLS